MPCLCFWLNFKVGEWWGRHGQFPIILCLTNLFFPNVGGVHSLARILVRWEALRLPLQPSDYLYRTEFRGIYSSNGTGLLPPVRYPGYQFSSLIFPPFNRHFTLKIEISSPDPPNNYFLLHFWAIISPKI